MSLSSESSVSNTIHIYLYWLTASNAFKCKFIFIALMATLTIIARHNTSKLVVPKLVQAINYCKPR